MQRAHRELVDRPLWSDTVDMIEWHFELDIHDVTAEDGWLPHMIAIDDAFMLSDLEALSATLSENEASRLEIKLGGNRGGDGFYGVILEGGAALLEVLGYVGLVETLRLPQLFRRLVRHSHGVPVDELAIFQRTGELPDEARDWLRQDYSQHLDNIAGVTGLSRFEARMALEQAGFHRVEPSGQYWVHD
ncbi:hypothetical protein C5C46_07385 [Rathayibacter sp. AY1E6]|nr:hypothetical protein C5C46_07385 [Rathayibacter sp. AY1E6]